MALTPQQMIGNLRDVLTNLRSILTGQRRTSNASTWQKAQNPKIMQMWGEDIRGAAAKYGIGADLLANLINAESAGNPNAVSPVGARGLTQIMPSTERSEGLSTRTPRDQIYSGAKYLSKLLALTGGNVRNALASYNAGYGAVKKYGGVPPYKETQNYVKKILGS